jgi:AcrR family transcriptional regulator
LRERKKEATRKAMGVAALRLALERGLDNVRVADIAAAAGVSQRTFNNYFASREEAICALGAARAGRTVAALKGRPASEPLAEALVDAMVGNDGETEPDKAMFRLMVCDPALRGEYFKATIGIHRQLTEVVAARAGMDADELLPSVAAAAYQGAARAGLLYWLRSDCTRSLSEVLREALSALGPFASALQQRGQRQREQRQRGQRQHEDARREEARREQQQGAEQLVATSVSSSGD